MTELQVTRPPSRISGLPTWIEPSLHITHGRDPLGLGTISTDKVIPRLVPGVLALSIRARYFSLHSFLLDQYARRRLPADNQSLSAFIKRCEYDYALAVLHCPHGCGSTASGIVGTDRARPAFAEQPDRYGRQESVKSSLGGYGLYYKSPMADLGLVVPAGTASLGGQLTPVDLLTEKPLPRRLVSSFETAISSTAYYRQHLWGVEPVPSDVLQEYAEQACLCHLDEHPEEQTALRELFFTDWTEAPSERPLLLRRQSFALYLELLAAAPQLAMTSIELEGEGNPDSYFHLALWSFFEETINEGSPRSAHAARWAALIAKEFMQDALSSIWSELCRRGIALQSSDGLSPDQVANLLRQGLLNSAELEGFLDQAIDCSPERPTADLVRDLRRAAADTPLEVLRARTAELDTAISGLATILILHTRLRELAPPQPEWARIGAARGTRQPGLLRTLRWLDEHLETEPTIADTMESVTRRFVLRPHEAIAYSKLPNFTFRFRWEDGRLRFYPRLHNGRFGLRDIRRNAMTQLSRDLGFWRADASGRPGLTDAGRGFVLEVFPQP